MITEEMARACVPPRGFINSWVSYGYNATDCNFAYHILGGLLLLGQTFPSYLNVSLGAKTHGNLFGLVVGESTKSRKTTSLKLVRAIAEDVWGAKSCPVSIAPGSDPAIIDYLVKNPRCLIMYEEFGDFLQHSMTGPLESLRTKYTELYDAGVAGRLLSSKRSRDGALIDDSRVVEAPRLSIGGAVNTQYLEDFTTSTDWMGGFLARFITFYAHRERNYDLTETPRAWYAQCRDQLLQFLDIGLLMGPCEGLDEDAKRIWIAWNAELRKLENAQKTHTHAEASIARAVPMALKIALLLMWDIGGIRQTRETPWRINGEAMWYACAIVNLHVHSVLTLLPTFAGSKDQRECRMVTRVVAKADRPLTLGQIMERAQLPMKRRVQEICESLCESGALMRVSTAGSKGLRFAVGGGADNLAIDPNAAHTVLTGSNEGGAQVIPLFQPPAHSSGDDLNDAGEAVTPPNSDPTFFG